MAIEKRLFAAAPVLFTADGTNNGKIEVPDACDFKVQQLIKIQSATQGVLDLQIKRIHNNTTMYVGLVDRPISHRQDISAYTVADGAFIFAIEQQRPNIPFEEYMRAIYAEEPTVAMRTFSVDKCGDPWSVDNPFPVQLSDGSINVGTVNAELEVQLSHRDNYPDLGDIHDSVRIGGLGIYEADVTPDNRLQVTTAASPHDNPKEAIMCADDVHVDYTWAEIDGVRRITQILWSSASVAATLSLTSASLQRDYTYQIADPFDLIDRDDTLLLVP